jgi:hypothetical protein
MFAMQLGSNMQLKLGHLLKKKKLCIQYCDMPAMEQNEYQCILILDRLFSRYFFKCLHPYR